MTRISSAGVAATLALCLSLSSTAYAAERLGKNIVKSRNIAPKAVKSSDIKPGAVNGSHVDESTLGTVPSAVSAQHATTADFVGGVREQSVRAALPSNATIITLATIDGLVIRFGCGPNFSIIEVRSVDPSDYGLLSVTGSGGVNSHQWFGINSLPESGVGVSGTNAGVVTLLRANGRTVRFDFHLRYEVGGMASTNDCFIAGFARSMA